MDTSQAAIEKVNEALLHFIGAGQSGNSSDLASKLQELCMLISMAD